MNQQQKITFNDGVKTIKASFLAFPKVWWRIALINLTSFLMILLGVLLFGGLLFLSLGIETVQNIFTNINMNAGNGTSVLLAPYFQTIGAVFFLFICWAFIFGSIGKIAGILAVKDYVKKKETNPFVLYFVKSWSYFWKYVGGSFRVFWYITWPILVVLIALFILGKLLLSSNSIDIAPIVIIAILAILFFIPFFIFLVYRSIKALFTTFFIIHSDKSISQSFENSLKIVKGNFWIIFGSFVLITFPFLILGWINSVLDYFITAQENINYDYLLYSLEILDFLINFFIFAPIMISFVYFLMVHIAKIKHIK